MADETKFSVLCSLFTWIQKTKSSVQKRSKFRKFIDTFCKPKDYFTSLRLILPNLDRERGSYGLKESVLATCLIDALGMSRDSEDAVRLINWRKGGPKTGVNVGNFALVAAEVLQRRQGMISGDLTINELNELLDRLAACENRAEKTSVLSTLIKKTNAQEMKWIVMIILKDMKLGISERIIFHEFHPDAEDLFNVTCDLKLVCEKLSNRSQRHKRQDIEVGKAVRPQLAMRVSNVNAAWKKLVGKEMVAECKFDGDRIQIHKKGTEIHFFSRNFLDHPEYGHAMSNIIIENILVDKCILDGEMLVWDSSLNRFADFGSNQEIAKAAKEGFESGRQLCYVAFDVLYVGDTSVIHQTLKERHALLRKVVNPLKGRLEILVPTNGINANRLSGEPCWSLVVYNVNEIECFFKETVENRDEGIVLKDLGSKWEPSDRSGKWLKLKPDYVHPGSDLDVLIIGGYYGSGRRGGEVSQFLVGLAEPIAPGTHPKKFVSFCRVGTGLSDDQLDEVVTKLKPFFRKYEYPRKAPPSCYRVTNNSKERPDVWIESPEKSIILSITSDIRTIRSDVFSAPYNLRFPRIDQVRYDKPWFECLDVQSFIDLVHSSNGTTQRRKDNDGTHISQLKTTKSSKRGEKKSYSVVPSHFIQTDVSNIQGESLIFSNIMFYFVNVPSTHSIEALHKLVVENGGTFSMNLNNSVTHRVASDSKGIKYQAAKLHGDIIDISWVLDSCRQKKLQPLHLKYFLFLSESLKKKLQEDKCPDSYDQDLDIVDLKNLLSNVDKYEDSQIIEYYKKKYCPRVKWGRFQNCCILFLLPMQPIHEDLEVILKLTMRRMKLEVIMGGGKISNDLVHASHLVVFSLPDITVNFDTILKSFSLSEKHLLYNKKLLIVQSQWLEDCLDKNQKLEEDAYSMKSDHLEFKSIKEGEQGIGFEGHLCSDNTDELNLSSSNKEDEKRRGISVLEKHASPERDSKRKRGPTGKSTAKGRTHVSQVQRTRARVGKKHAKIDQENGASSEEETGNSFVYHRAMVKQSPEPQKYEILENSKQTTEQKGEQEDCSKPGKNANAAHGADLDGLTPDKLEIMVDPVQAMLLDMIPSLGMKRVETLNPVIHNEKKSIDPTEEPVKKRKVSYKDVADELLKKW